MLPGSLVPRCLAGTAFEAYLEPVGAEGCQEVGVNGTRTTYTDCAFLAAAFDGILQAGGRVWVWRLMGADRRV